MSSHRKPRLFGARKRARAVTLCAATIGAAAMPALAQAATAGSGATTAVAVTPKATTHLASAVLRAAALQEAKATNTGKVVAVSDNTKKSSTSSSSTSAKADSASSSTRSDKSYTVVSGDTLSGIAERALGDGDKYPELFSLNKNKSEPDGRTFTDPNLIVTGWTIELPADSKSAEESSGSSSSSSSSSSSNSSSSSSASTSSSSDSSSSASSSSASTTADSASSSSSSSSYSNDLDGWIKEAISILSEHGYSVSYNAIYETAMNESSGNPDAQNNSDSNAAAGNPSEGLLQTTQTTFDAYALSGYNDIWNPVDNIIAAAIYAQDTYGGLDVVVADRCGGSCWYGY
jgi:hypothetical protein